MPHAFNQAQRYAQQHSAMGAAVSYAQAAVDSDGALATSPHDAMLSLFERLTFSERRRLLSELHARASNDMTLQANRVEFGESLCCCLFISSFLPA